MKAHCRELLVIYLCNLPSAPLNLRRPGSVWALYDEVTGNPPHKRLKYYDRDAAIWQAHKNSNSELVRWLKSDQAFVCPEAWPCEGFPDRVTPEGFALCVMPRSEKAKSSTLWSCPNIEYLGAWAHGWPVPKRDWPKMQEAMVWLMGQAQFIIWAYNLNIDAIPLPFSHISYFRRLEARRLLSRDPLAPGAKNLLWSLPKTFQDINTLLNYSQSKTPYFGRSSRLPHIRYLTPPLASAKEIEEYNRLIGG